MGDSLDNEVGEVKSSKKAKLTVIDSNGNRGKEIILQFNPSQYDLSSGASYSSYKDNKKKDKQQFIQEENETLRFSFYLDTPFSSVSSSESNDQQAVWARVQEIKELVKIKEEAHKPPMVQVDWGDIQFQGHVTSLSTTFTQFTDQGIALRAKVDLEMRGCSIEKKPKASPDRTKSRVLSEGTSIWTLAKNEYGDMNEWRRIAKANSILNPFDIETGQILEIPAIVAED